MSSTTEAAMTPSEAMDDLGDLVGEAREHHDELVGFLRRLREGMRVAEEMRIADADDEMLTELLRLINEIDDTFEIGAHLVEAISGGALPPQTADELLEGMYGTNDVGEILRWERADDNELELERPVTLQDLGRMARLFGEMLTHYGERAALSVPGATR
jgi:hypothetical protein